LACLPVGDVLCVYTAIDRIGRTSMQIYVEAWAQRLRTRRREKVTDATFTFVAVDERPADTAPILDPNIRGPRYHH
jgi:acyl-CoA thioesterase YciA